MACTECPHCRLVSSIKAKPRGIAPFGFRWHEKELEFDPTENGNGWLLARILIANNRNTSTREIAQALNAQEVKGPGGGEWSYGIVARVIRQGKNYSHLIPLEYVLTD